MEKEFLDLTTAVLDTIPEESKKKLLNKPASELGEGFGNTFYVIFYPFLKARIKLEAKIEAFKNEIVEKHNRIPSTDRIEAPLNILGPALEASKYHIEEEAIRSMFANLIASSMDTKQHHNVHPSFVEIVKQLTPFDASVLSSLVYWNENPVGVANVTINHTNGTSYGVWFRNIFPFPDLTFENVDRYCASIDNLIRLSIIEVTYDSNYTNKNYYDGLTNSTFLTECRESFMKTQGEDNGFKLDSVDLVLGMWEFTTFGSNFVSCCL